MDAPKRGRGRPTLYREEYCDRVVELGLKGYSVAQMACELGVSREVLWDWMEAHPDFLHAMRHARSNALTWWERTAQENLGARYFNAALWAKSMSARFPDDYREKQDINITGKLDIAEAISAARQRAG